MNSPLPHRPLRFATTQAYDAALRGPGRFWVERSAEEFSLDEALRTARSHREAVGGISDDVAVAERSINRDGHSPEYGNPLRDEPSPVVIGAVKRFGLVGLMTCAVSAGIARWWNSLSHSDH